MTMNNLLKSFNDLSISRRLFILFTVPQALLSAMLAIELWELKEETAYTGNVIIILLLVMISLTALYLLIQRTITRPLLNAVQNGLDAISGVMNNITTNRKTDNNILIKNDGTSETRQTVNAFFCLATELNDIVEREKEINADLEGKAEFILDVVSRAAVGDLTGDMMVFSGTDSVAQVAAGVSTMLANLNNLVKQVQVSGIQVTSSATEIAATSKEQEATVAEQAASTNQIMSTITEISATGNELLHTMDEVRKVAENTAVSANQGQLAMTSMENTMEQMRAATESISSKLAVLSEKADNINNVVTTINRVADQTNLLSLNAAIEAEKAGEYGRGFSVVATEIRRLADQTAVATWDIEQMVKEMLSAVSAGVMSMDKFREEVNRGVNDVAKVGVQLSNIIEQVQALLPRFETATEGMRLQAEGAEQIKESMIQLNETAQQTAESLHQSNQSIDQLKEAARGLQEGVSLFKVTD
ncbi:MAG: methyl-accepting chemotaxis protein WspA [Pseudomonadota bacterium]|nr:methyl-accepting chemotaxis protein WspA [Pseudomonadota bacterium]